MSKQYGPHNTGHILEALEMIMTSAGEAAAGIRRNAHWSQQMQQGIVGVQGMSGPMQAAAQAQQAQAVAHGENELAVRQVRNGLEAYIRAHGTLDAALSMAPQASVPPTPASGVAAKAGQAPGPRLALA